VEGGAPVAVLFCWLAVALLFVCAVLFFTPLRKLGCWLMAIFPAALCAAVLKDLAKGSTKVGAATYHSDLLVLLPLMGFLAITVVAALRPRWGWLFWIGWVLNAGICALIVFLTYFWKVFS
jgi:hypothetical protein